MTHFLIAVDDGNPCYLRWEKKPGLFPWLGALFVFRSDKEGAVRIPRRYLRWMLWRANRYTVRLRKLAYPERAVLP